MPAGATSPPPAPPRSAIARWIRYGAAFATMAALAIGVGLFLPRHPSSIAAKQGHVRAVGTASLQVDDSGHHVRWQSEAIDITLDRSFTDLAGGEVFSRALDAWRTTGAALPSISTRLGEGRHVGYDATGVNENVVVFAPAGWTKAHGALAITVLTYDSGSGAILDADLLVNGGGRYFANFDHDEARADDDAVSIEGGTSAASDARQGGAGTSRYDVQGVVTHELGHVLGLGEDRDDDRATMYVSTRPGEIHKRVLTASDSQIITALYAEPSIAHDQTGCGGAHLARAGGLSRGGWIGFGLAVVGLRCIGTRRARRVGLGIVSIALFVLLLPPDLRAAAPEDRTTTADAEVQVIGSVPRWEQGILETELTYRVSACHVARCPDSDQSVAVTGGSLGGVTQIVGPFAVPEVGNRLLVSLRDGRGLLKVLSPLFKP